ncbi:MAG: hypothetical protein QM571_05030 [Micrococcaceae bacterium]
MSDTIETHHVKGARAVLEYSIDSIKFHKETKKKLAAGLVEAVTEGLGLLDAEGL